MKPLPKLAPRKPDSHKGDFGRALLIGGSPGMAGAIGLAGMAALRGGAGLVKLAVPTTIQATVAGFEPSYMTIGLPANEQGELTLDALVILGHHLDEATCIAIGPGLGRSAALTKIVAILYRDVPCPLIIDADGLNALATRADILPQPAGPRIMTPHPGEFARLVGKQVATEDRDLAARDLAARAKAVVLLKGHRTLITDGQQTYFNETGNPGMATGGSGDVLTGIITALVCQGLSPLDAARLGAYVHGMAGDLATAELGQVAVIASDLLRFLPAALRQVS